jgi:hypothetical protein
LPVYRRREGRGVNRRRGEGRTLIGRKTSPPEERPHLLKKDLTS